MCKRAGVCCLVDLRLLWKNEVEFVVSRAFSLESCFCWCFVSSTLKELLRFLSLRFMSCSFSSFSNALFSSLTRIEGCCDDCAEDTFACCFPF